VFGSLLQLGGWAFKGQSCPSEDPRQPMPGGLRESTSLGSKLVGARVIFQIVRDAAAIQAIEEHKTDLLADDPKVTGLSIESGRLAREVVAKTNVQTSLAKEARRGRERPAIAGESSGRAEDRDRVPQPGAALQALEGGPAVARMDRRAQ
jgi:hypothetical protein